jgi:regulator of sigma E protease
LLTLIVTIVMFGVLIFFHESGHFIAAKLSDVKVEEFALGLGPAIFKKQKGETLYSLRVFPFGGFCRMLGEDEENDDPRSFNKKSIGKRFAILVSGSLMNILLGFVIIFIVVTFTQAVPSTTVSKFDRNAISNTYGLQIGDKIKAIDSNKIRVSTDISYTMALASKSDFDITVERNGKTVLLKNVRFPTQNISGIPNPAPVQDFYVLPLKKTPSSVIYTSFFDTISTTKAIWQSLIDIFSGRYVLTEVATGPVGTISAINTAAKSGIGTVSLLMMFITINLGIVNLLPIPALDGGRLLFIVIEAIRGKPVNPECEGYIHTIGFVVLIGFMLFITFFDIKRIFGI